MTTGPAPARAAALAVALGVLLRLLLPGVDGPAELEGTEAPLQDAFWTAHGLQCGFCTPGILISMEALLRENASPTDDEIRAGLSGNLCRCTGYQNIVKAVRLAVQTREGGS